MNPIPAKLAPPWWLAPTVLFAMVVGGTMLAAVCQSDHAFQLYGTPKFVTANHLLLSGLIIVAFAIGGQLAGVSEPLTGAPAAQQMRLAEQAFWITATLTFFGYAIWFVVGVKNGFTIGTLREFLTTDSPGLAEEIRSNIFTNLKGVTTCTQFGVAAVPLGTVLLLHGVRRVCWPLLALLVLAAARALVFSERLALIELALPAAVIILRLCWIGQVRRPIFRQILTFAPVIGVAVLLTLFGGFEYFRSWRYYQHKFDSYAEFTVWRIAGYYTTAHNNSAMALTTQRPYPVPYTTLRSLWSIPGLERTPLGYQQITGVDPARRHEAMLERYGTPELNNEGGLFQPALDYGLAGLLLYWFVCGFVATRAYQGFLRGTLAGLVLYPLLFLAILETPRLLYLTYTRSLPAIITIALITWLATRSSSQLANQPRLAAIPGSALS